MKTPTIADLAAKPYYFRSSAWNGKAGRRHRRNKSGVRGYPSVQAFAKALCADGWNVTLERRADMTDGRKCGRIYITDPQDFFWTYFRAEKGDVVFQRECSSIKFGWVFHDILRHYGYCINADTNRYELEDDNERH
jgi:hypothetical protein